MPYEKIGKEVRCIADEIPFEIPDSWEWVRLETAILTEMGQSPSGESVSTASSGVEFHQGKVFFGEKFLLKSNQTTSQPSKIVEAGTILLCVRAPVGKVNIAQRKICIGRGLCGITPIIDIDSNFLYYLLESYENIFIKKATGTTFVAITAEVVKKQLIPLPPLAEQKRIVAKIEELLPHIEEYGKAESKVSKLNAEFPEQLKKSILQWAIQGKLVPQNPDDELASVLLERIRAEKAKLIKEGKIKKDKNESIIFRRDNSHYEKLNGVERCIDDEIPFEIPDTWVWVRLNELGEYRKGPFGSSLTKSMFVPKSNTSIKVYEQKNAIQKDHTLGSYYITDKYYKEKMSGFSVLPGDIIVSCAGTIGETYVLPQGIAPGIINQALMRMRIYAPISIEYFLIYFDYALKQAAKKSSKGSAIKNIPPFDIFKNLLLPLPPLTEQQRIVKAIESVCKKMTI